MSAVQVAQRAGESGPATRIVNDFSIQVATVNGSGSQTANLVLLRSIFQMGIPVSGKNMFPSNIAGLPTWFTIRANKRGYIGRKKEVDVLVAVNPETAQEDVMGLDPGAAVVYDEPLGLDKLRDDVVFYPVPFDKLVAPACPEVKLRKLVRTMIYDGVLAKLLDIDIAEMEKATTRMLGRKGKALEYNLAALKAGWDYAEANLPKQDPFAVERMNETQGMILIDGNSATAIGALFAGVTVVGWYPITPASGVGERLTALLKKYRNDEDGKATFAVVQAEDELAALGVVLGGGWAGARSMTATSGPGVSLMAELTGLGYYTEVPAVIVNVQRSGPSTGLPTRTQQADIISTAVLSHGDTKHPMLFPNNVAECYTLTIEAFELAEWLQTPVFVMTDLDLGMNTWMSQPFPYPDKPIDRGKVLDAATLERLGGIANWGRYKDVDGDGIGYRSLPYTGMPAYFNRGSGHNEYARYSEREEDYQQVVDRLNRKFETARERVPKPEIHDNPKAKIGIIAFGTSDAASLESRDQLREEYGVEAAYLRLRAYPFTKEVTDFIDRFERIYVVEQNRDGQMAGLMRLEMRPDQIAKLRNVLYYAGMPIDARTITNQILAQEGVQA